MAFDETLAARVREALDGRRDVEEKRMFGGVAFMVRGHMACGVVRSSLMVRVRPEDCGRFLKEKGARPMDFTGRPMPGFLFVDSPGIASAASLARWVGRATARAEAAPARPRRKPAPARKRPRR